jgi:vesicle-associated membrane protein 7
MVKQVLIDYLKDISFDFQNYLSYHTNTNHRNYAVLLKEKMLYYNDPKNDKIHNIKTHIEDVKNIMLENIEQVLKRGENIDILVNETSILNDESVSFLSSAKQIKRKLWWKKCKISACLLLIFIILIITCIFVVCKPNLSECHTKN